MKRLRFLILASASALVLAGCRADITYRFDVHPNNTMTVTAREVVDDQLYQMASAQQNSADPFGLEQAKSNGWDVSRTTDDSGNHVISITRTMPVTMFATQSITEMPKNIGNTSKGLTFNPGSITRKYGLFTDTETLETSIPALIPKSETASTEDESTSPYGAASAQMAAAMITSMIGLHLELRTPGKLVGTNGELTPNGFVRWNLNLQGPTDIQYSVQSPDLPHIGIAIVLALIVLVLLVTLIVRRSRAASVQTVT